MPNFPEQYWKPQLSSNEDCLISLATGGQMFCRCGTFTSSNPLEAIMCMGETWVRRKIPYWLRRNSARMNYEYGLYWGEPE